MKDIILAIFTVTSAVLLGAGLAILTLEKPDKHIIHYMVASGPECSVKPVAFYNGDGDSEQILKLVCIHNLQGD